MMFESAGMSLCSEFGGAAPFWGAHAKYSRPCTGAQMETPVNNDGKWQLRCSHRHTCHPRAQVLHGAGGGDAAFGDETTRAVAANNAAAAALGAGAAPAAASKALKTAVKKLNAMVEDPGQVCIFTILHGGCRFALGVHHVHDLSNVLWPPVCCFRRRRGVGTHALGPILAQCMAWPKS